MPVGPRLEKFNIVSNDHGRTQKYGFCVLVGKTNFTDRDLPDTINSFSDSFLLCKIHDCYCTIRKNFEHFHQAASDCNSLRRVCMHGSRAWSLKILNAWQLDFRGCRIWNLKKHKCTAARFSAGLPCMKFWKPKCTAVRFSRLPCMKFEKFRQLDFTAMIAIIET